MPILYFEVQKEVKKRLKPAVYKEMLDYVESADPSLWGMTKPRYFTKRMFVLAMYHDITAYGYGKILLTVQQIKCGDLTPKTLQHNTQCIRRTLAEWGRKKVDLGKKKEWEKAMKHVKGTKRFPGLMFWIDSVDFALENVGGKKKKSLDWSYKCNSRGRRYMALIDGKGKFRKLWGGYSPKVFDGHFLQLARRWFEKRLKGAGVMGDQHFEWGKNLKGLKWYTANLEPRGRRSSNTTQEDELDTDDEAKDISVLTKDQKSYNASLYKLRARVELPFGEIKTLFKVLSLHWRERESQLDYLVWIAAGIINAKK
jgi:hypothetical protein